MAGELRGVRRAVFLSAVVAATLGLGAMVVGCGPAGDDEEDAVGNEEELTSCAIPQRYDLDHFLSHHDHVVGKEFQFAKEPSMGVYVHEMFIPDEKVQVLDTGYGQTVKMLGDGRDFDPRFDPAETRAFLVVDFVEGRAWMGVNASHMEVCQSVIFGHICHTFESDPHPIQHAWHHGQTWVWGDWIDADTFRVRVRAMVSVPGPVEDLPGHAGIMGVCAQDHQLLFDKQTHTVKYEGDKYPSTSTYRWSKKNGECTPTKVQRKRAGDPDDLCADPSYTHNTQGSPFAFH